MPPPIPDPTRWFIDLLTAEQTGGLWADAVARTAAWQLDTIRQLTAGWASMWTGGTERPTIDDRRFAGEQWMKNPLYEAVARTYLAQTDLLRTALDAAPLDERTRGQWEFAMRQVTDALSPANALATNPEALQLRSRDRRASLIEG